MPAVSFTSFIDGKISSMYHYKLKKLRSLSSDATIPKLTGAMSTFRIRTMPILEKNVFSGIVTQSDIAKYLPPEAEILPTSVLKARNFDFDELNEGSKAFKTKTIKEVFEEILNIKDDELIAVLSSDTSLYETIQRFTKKGAKNRRYRTLVIRDNIKCDGVLSYLDVFKILLNQEHADVMGGLLSQKIGALLPAKKIVITPETDSLCDAIFTLNRNLFTHLPIAESGTATVVGLIDEVMVRSLQYDVIYEYLEDMELSKILEIQRPNFGAMLLPETATFKQALEKFTSSAIRPTTLLIGEMNGASSAVVENTLSYVDMMHITLKFMDDQKTK